VGVTKLRNFYQKFEYQAVITALVDPSATDIVPAKTGYRSRVTKIHFNVTTDAAVTLAIQDDATTPVVVHQFPASVGVGGHDINFEDQGFACTVSKNLDLAASGAGYAGSIRVEGYYEPVGPFDVVTTKP